MGVITIHTKAMWGGITIIVPPNVIVEQNGRAILGGFGGSGGLYHRCSEQARVASAQDIVMKISGTSVMGGISTSVNRLVEPARLVAPDEAARIMREAPPVNELDVVRNVLGGVFGDLVGGAAANLHTAPPAPGAQQSTQNASATQNDQHIHGAPAVSPSLVVQGIPVQDTETPTLLSTPARPDTNVSAPKPSAPLVAQEQPLGVDSPTMRDKQG